MTILCNLIWRGRRGACPPSSRVRGLIYSLGDLSGGHFNPAVTLAVLLGGRGKISKPDSLKYALAQIVSRPLRALK